jgi:drug/metabolite transporter (DMT)-like permease
LAAVLLKEHLPKAFFGWAALAIAGTYLMVFGFGAPVLDTGDKTVLAALYALVATVAFAMSTVFSKRALRHVDFKMSTYLRFLLTAFLMLIISTITADVGKIEMVSKGQWIVLLMIVFATGGPAIFLYYYGLNRISASVATICELAFPLTSVVLEYFVHDQIMNLPQWLGVSILIFSIIQVSKFHLANKPNGHVKK